LGAAPEYYDYWEKMQAFAMRFLGAKVVGFDVAHNIHPQ
jgi:hypothetical protein